MDTIYALSSGAPPAAIAVVRLSGPAARGIAEQLGGALPRVREASLRVLRASDGGVLDRALVLFFPAPASATGEDVVEFHLHGGRAVVAAVRAALAAAGAREAEPGEFTRRALGNGRIDLAQAEGLADLLAAETERQRRVAITASEGQLSRQVRHWSAELAIAAAALEAAIDYADEGDTMIVTAAREVDRHVASVARTLDQVLDAPAVERLHQGFRVVVAGPRNSGKSSLVNALSGIDAAIVSPMAGTTRDRVEVRVVRDGLAYALVDTAGLGDSEDAIELIGMERARAALATADLLLWTGPGEAPVEGSVIALQTKADEATALVAERVPLSVFDAGSIERLWGMIAAWADAGSRVEDAPYNARQRVLLGECQEALQRFSNAADELVQAEELRVAREQLGRITGGNAPEEMLDQLFARFCVGK